MSTELKALGSTTKYTYDRVASELLERFPAPAASGAQDVYIRTSEFSSLCPKTGQPDWATIVVTYVPDRWCVESKSYKLFLGSFRMVGMFHEACVDRICKDLVALLDPIRLEVRGEFTPRGGISFWPTSRYSKKD